MSVQRPSLWRVFSDTSRMISSNALHFAALSLLFIFPVSLFNIIHSFNLPPSPSPSPSPSPPPPPSPFNSHHLLFLSTVGSNSQIPSFDASQIRHQPLLGLALIIFNIFSVSSVTHSIFHAYHRNPIKLSSSLKSILSSFLPLLATKLAYFIIFVAIFLGFEYCIGKILAGLEIDPATKPFMAVAMIPYVYLWVEWCLADAVVVVESRYGFASLKRSSTLVKGMRLVAFQMIALLAILQGIIYWRFSVLGGGGGTSSGECGGGVALQMVDYAVLSTALTLFGVAANTVLFIHCKAVNGESEELDYFQSDKKKLSQISVQLPRDVVDDA